MTRLLTAAVVLNLAVSVVPAAAADDAAASIPQAPMTATKSEPRPPLLAPLYASYAALQAYDVYSTRHALALGGHEANLMMQGVATSTGAMVAVKAGAVAGAIFASERLWRTNKTAAIAVMIASNSVAMAVAAHNAHTLRQIR